MNPIRAKDIFLALGELASDLLGDADRIVEFVRPVHEPDFGCLTYLKADEEITLLADEKLKGCVVICAFEQSTISNFAKDRTVILSSNPRLAFIRTVACYFINDQPTPGIHPTAVVSPTAKVDQTASIGPYVVIGSKCEIAAKVVLHPHVTLYSNVRIGRSSVVNSGTVIGADGFGYERNEQGVLEKFPHVGGVVIGENVEIGTNTSIDRGTLSDTVIGDRVRIDNLVHISHNVHIDDDSAVIAQAMIGGSARIGRSNWIAPGALVMNKVRVGACATVGMGAVVLTDVSENSTVTGSPAVPLQEFRKFRSAVKILISKLHSEGSI
jgi:UDP-3-O-[3-hydroxymyristoyl] glucosamine N-acyltransferase